MISASAPIFQAPKLSPMSQFRSMLFMCRSTPMFPRNGLDDAAKTLMRLAPRRLRFLQRALDEMHVAAGRELRESRNIGAGDLRDLRIASRGLVIGHQRDRRSVVRHLNR